MIYVTTKRFIFQFVQLCITQVSTLCYSGSSYFEINFGEARVDIVTTLVLSVDFKWS
jgi:hypothetical protein